MNTMSMKHDKEHEIIDFYNIDGTWVFGHSLNEFVEELNDFFENNKIPYEVQEKIRWIKKETKQGDD